VQQTKIYWFARSAAAVAVYFEYKWSTRSRHISTNAADVSYPPTSTDRDQPKLELARGTALAPLLTAKRVERPRPVFETRIERVVIPLHVGDSDIELAFDQGCVATVDAKLDVAEIEIELKHGDRSEAARLAKRLARNIPITPSVRAKADLGYALLNGPLDAPVFAMWAT
jgi:inorganic triphosphatase YgiF